MTPREKLELEILQRIEFSGEPIILLTKGNLARDSSGLLSYPMPPEEAIAECERMGARVVMILPDDGSGPGDLFPDS